MLFKTLFLQLSEAFQQTWQLIEVIAIVLKGKNYDLQPTTLTVPSKLTDMPFFFRGQFGRVLLKD